MNTAVLTSIDDVVSKAEAAFETCWQMLATLKSLDAEALTAADLYNFQPTLAEALFELDEVYRRLASDRFKLLENTGPEKEAHISALREIARRQDALSSVSAIGRSLGDAFAWFFYANSQDALVEHFKRQPIVNTPAGVGGFGELNFVRSVRSDTHFVLFHGITTFLRIGDVSFIEHGSWKATCLGELKTSLTGENTAKVELHMIGLAGSDQPRIWLVDQPRGAANFELREKSEQERRNTETKVKASLERQIKIMQTVVNAKGPDRKESLFAGYGTSALIKLGEDLRARDGVTVQVDRGLLLIGLRFSRAKTLLDAALEKRDPTEVVNPLENLATEALLITDPNRSDNSLEVGEIGPGVRIGFLPLFWWKMDMALLKEIYFRKTLIMSLYNPVFLLDKLRAKGFNVDELRTTEGIECELTRRVGKLLFKVENFYFFRALISLHLISEEAIVQAIVSLREGSNPEPNTRIQMWFTHQIQV